MNLTNVTSYSSKQLGGVVIEATGDNFYGFRVVAKPAGSVLYQKTDTGWLFRGKGRKAAAIIAAMIEAGR